MVAPEAVTRELMGPRPAVQSAEPSEREQASGVRTQKTTPCKEPTPKVFKGLIDNFALLSTFNFFSSYYTSFKIEGPGGLLPNATMSAVCRVFEAGDLASLG